MRKKLKPIIAASIVLVGTVFIKLGNIDNIWMFLVSVLQLHENYIFC